MPKITEYSQVTDFDANDVLLKDGVNGTKTIKVEDAANALASRSYLSTEMALENYYAASSSDWQLATLAASGSGTNVRAQESTTRLTFVTRIPVTAGRKLAFTCPMGAKYRVFFSAVVGPVTIGTSYATIDAGIDDRSEWHANNRTITVPNGAISFMVCLAFSDDSEITLQTKPNLQISLDTVGTTITETDNAIEGSTVNVCPNDSDWQNMSLSYTGNTSRISPTASTTAVAFKYRYNVKPGMQIKFTCPSGAQYRAIFCATSGPITQGVYLTPINTPDDDVHVWNEQNRILTVPDDAASLMVNVINKDRTEITPATRPAVTIQIISLQASIGEIRSRVSMTSSDRYAGKLISILGDSISGYAGANASTASDDHKIADGTYTYSGNHCHYPVSSVNNVDSMYWAKLITKLGMTLDINDSWAGSRVSWDGTEGDDYGADKYMASPTRLGHLDDNGTPDIILVNAGMNDIGNDVALGTFNTESPIDYTDAQISALPVATFADAYRALLIRLQKTYPLARVVVVLPNYAKTSNSQKYNPQKVDSYSEIVKEACDYFGVPWVDMRATGMNMFNTSTYLHDGLHPSAAGMNLMYDKLLNFFLYEL